MSTKLHCTYIRTVKQMTVGLGIANQDSDSDLQKCFKDNSNERFSVVRRNVVITNLICTWNGVQFFNLTDVNQDIERTIFLVNTCTKCNKKLKFISFSFILSLPRNYLNDLFIS